jgi:uncharacterized protein (TIGR00369 family)
MQGKKVRESSILMAQVMNPQDANPAGNVHGGFIMKLIDTAAGAAAIKHSRSNCVTASVDRLDFHNPVFIGDLVTLRSGLNYTGKSSMEVGVRVESQNLLTGEIRHTVSAYLTLVALDKNGKPLAVSLCLARFHFVPVCRHVKRLILQSISGLFRLSFPFPAC